jgi:MFS family permease
LNVGVLGGYGTVWAERPVRRLLVASLAGRVAFSMLPLGVVLFATDATGSSATTGALIAAFLLASTLGPLRGRVVDRRGPPALIGFALACAAGLVALWAAGAGGASPVLLLALGALCGAVLPPLGPFTRAVWGASLRGRGTRLQHVYALDSAGEEAALIIAPLIVAAIFAAGSPGGALVVAGLGLLAGTAAAARSELASFLAPAHDAPAVRARARLPATLWLVIASVLGPGAALGAVDVAVPALTRHAGKPATAGLLLAALAAGTAASSLIAGRRNWKRPPMQRLALLQVAFSAALALAAAASSSLEAVAAALVIAGGAVGALFVTVYVLVDELTPQGEATRTFAWLAAANNAGIAAGAAASGALISGLTDAAGLWLAAGCGLAGATLAAVATATR